MREFVSSEEEIGENEGLDRVRPYRFEPIRRQGDEESSGDEHMWRHGLVFDDVTEQYGGAHRTIFLKIKIANKIYMVILSMENVWIHA